MWWMNLGNSVDMLKIPKSVPLLSIFFLFGPLTLRVTSNLKICPLCRPTFNSNLSKFKMKKKYIYIYIYIRHKDFHLVGLCLWRSGYPPWTLKRGGLKSSGRTIISSIGKTKKKHLFSTQKKNKKIQKNLKWFWDFSGLSEYGPLLTICGFLFFMDFFWIFWIFFRF